MTSTKYSSWTEKHKKETMFWNCTISFSKSCHQWH